MCRIFVKLITELVHTFRYFDGENKKCEEDLGSSKYLLLKVIQILLAMYDPTSNFYLLFTEPPPLALKHGSRR
jgi:hypothetical protein